MPKKIKRRIVSKRATPDDKIKMSEVIMDFAEPLLNCSEGDGSKEKAISLAILCWNLALLPQDAQGEELKRMLNSFDGDNAKAMDSTVRMMFQRKTKYFPYINKCVVEYEILRRGDDVHLQVASTEI